jgi:hypothetical protein
MVNGYLLAVHGSWFGGFTLPIFAVGRKPRRPMMLRSRWDGRAGFEPLRICSTFL